MSENKKTILYTIHENLGAKIAPFGGYLMPIQYEGILSEHEAGRTKAAIFDTCHMGEFFLEGESAETDLEKILSCPVSDLAIGQCRYGFICNENGGVIDDQIVYRLDEQKFMLVVNSSTQENDFQWISQHLSPTTTIENRSDETAKIDIQGPSSAKIVQTLVDSPIDDLKYFRFMENIFEGVECIVSRTGYTGEIGFEIYLPALKAEELWTKATDLGATPAGLGARDTLRLEIGMPLYGHELNEEQNPLETGYDRSIKRETPFIGSEKVLSEDNAPRILCGLSFEGRQKPKDGELVSNSTGETIGIVTSGGFSPSLNKGIALAYINKSAGSPDSEIIIQRKRKDLTGQIVSLPIYKEATGRKKLSSFL